MYNLLGTQVFWTTVVAVPIILAAFAIVGRIWAASFPTELRLSARFYMAPVLGLATFILIGSFLGRHLQLGNSIFVPVALCLAVAVGLWRDSARQELPHYLIYLGLFGILCGTSLLAPLYVAGATNVHNDAFTYLAQSNWLQQHAFTEKILPEKVTPAATQVLLYQIHSFRMGGSYLLAFFQAILNITWSYDIYPAVIISGIVACCMAIGFPIAELLLRVNFNLRWALLALPSFSLGGLVFGANLGFLPQTVGLAVSAGAIFAVGVVLYWMRDARKSVRQVSAAALPISIMLASVIFAYAEVSPFVIAAVGIGGLFYAAWFRAWRNVSIFGVAIGVVTLLLTNFELMRAYNSLMLQSGAVVGSPVPWSLPRFIAHALGIQAGAWDSPSFTMLAGSWSVFLAVLVILNLGCVQWRLLRATFGLQLPSLAILGILFTGLIYFRYFVPSPFPVGTGQSWSQFKLMEWAHPFASAAVLAVVASVLGDARLVYLRTMAVLLAVAAVGSSFTGIARTRGLMNYYENVSDLGTFYHDFRRTVTTACPLSSSVFLSLDGIDHKFRQLASVYLADRDIRSDWSSDGYISHYMPADKVRLSVTKGDCLVEPTHRAVSKMPATTIGPIRVGVFDGSQNLVVNTAEGAHGEEVSGSESWRWVERSVRFTFKTILPQDGRSRYLLQFEYTKQNDTPLQVQVTDKATHKDLRLDVDRSVPGGKFSHEVNAASITDLIFVISTTAEARPLGANDQRKAAFMIKNISVTTVLD